MPSCAVSCSRACNQRALTTMRLSRQAKWKNAARSAIRSAERIRYPRAYWDLIASKANGDGLDPYLVVSLMRQESWFNPDATSVSDARD